MKYVFFFYFLIFFLNGTKCGIFDIIDPTGFGPTIKATKGEVWPEPQIYNKTEDFLVLRPKYFKFEKNYSACSILDEAIERYLKIIEDDGNFIKRGLHKKNKTIIKKENFYIKSNNYKGFLDSLRIDFKGSCKDKMLPTLHMPENYELNVSLQESKLTSDSVWGILRGLETFSQLIYLNADVLVLQVNYTHIEDFPRFPHRGLHLDTARHFISKPYILEILDAMAFNKLNVFHWHITDDQSFPYQSITFPELSEKGAYDPYNLIYTQKDITEIIEYARLRGIRIIPEFDSPGHTKSWGQGIKDLLTPCYKDSKPNGKYGPIDPTKEKNFNFLKEFFKEITQVFPENYLHIGGDEVTYGYECWGSNPDIVNFMKEKKIKNFSALETYYINRLINIVSKLNSSVMAWAEAFSNNLEIPQNAIFHVWKENGKEVISNITKSGKNAVFSSCWYLDYLSKGGDWTKFYECDAADFPGDESQKKLVLGGEACMWAEAVNKHNVISRIWPRACAPAERLWSSERPVNLTDQTWLKVAERLEEHTCRLNRRGIDAQPPTGPGYCL